LLKGNYDPVRWSNFYGMGNQSPFFSKPVNYFRLRTAEWLGSIGLSRTLGINNFTLSGFYNSVRILRDANKFITNTYLPAHPENLRTNTFLGGSFKYGLFSVNDTIVPLSGVIFKAIASYTENLSDAGKSFAKFGGDVQFYIPLIPKISLAISTGAATITNTPEFYQYPAIGGGANLRGYIRDRFRGKTAFYNSNELRFITNINTYFLRGKGGLVAFFDDGRVWMPGQSSNTLHTSYGGGIIIAPFNISFFNITYGVSNETTQIQLRGVMKL
ncbi:MAG: BamA/TamA family outer membrane protein, partial [Ginsengibacter sp.]